MSALFFKIQVALVLFPKYGIPNNVWSFLYMFPRSVALWYFQNIAFSMVPVLYTILNRKNI